MAYLRAIPLIAVLLLSEAPLVYIISVGFIFKISAICFVEASITSFAYVPSLCKEFGLPINLSQALE